MHFLLRFYGNGIDYHTAFRFFYLVYFRGLPLDAHVPMDDPDAAFLCKADGGSGLGYRIHGRADNRDIESDIVGQQRGGIHISRKYIGLCRNQKQVIKSQRFHNMIF
ncbi:MAG: hypothetical protein ACD_87C00095G0003 [uncultured bacterium]|nr:MAG: hypothetical protein ACD_87C00095G0003 [uncultured bacterium]